MMTDQDVHRVAGDTVTGVDWNPEGVIVPTQVDDCAQEFEADVIDIGRAMDRLRAVRARNDRIEAGIVYSAVAVIFVCFWVWLWSI